MAKQNWYRCELDGYPYPAKDLTIHADTGLLVCKNCLISLKELDQEQEEIEKMREEKDFRREEMKGKAGYFDKEGP